MQRDRRLIRLSREHTQALMLAQRIAREAPTGSEDDLSDLFSRLVAFWSAGLLPHFTAEGECLLARLLRHTAEDDEHVLRIQRDHLQIEVFVASMRDATDGEMRRTLLLAFGETLRVHVRWEEEILFPTVETVFTEAELDALGSDLVARLPEHPHPWDALDVSPAGEARGTDRDAPA